MPIEINTPQFIAGIIILFLMLMGCVLDILIFKHIRRQKNDWLKSISTLKRRPWDIFDGIYILLVLSVFFASLILGSEISNKFGVDLSETKKKALLIIETLVMQGIAIAAIENLRRKKEKTITASFSRPKVSIGKSLTQAVMYYIAIMPLVILSSLVVNLIMTGFNIPVEPQEVLKEFIDPNSPRWIQPAMIFLASISAPITEELLFRGVALPIAAKYAPPSLAIFTASLAFAIIHANIAAVAPLLVFAIGLSLAYIHTQTILVPMMMHALFNTASITLLILFT